MHSKKGLLIGGIALAFSAVVATSQEQNTLWQIQKTLALKRYVDLTHEFAPGIPRWPGFPDETRKTIYWYDKRPDTMGVGFFSELFIHVGQWGTHVDPPAHFIKGLRTVDQIDLKEMILPALKFLYEDRKITASGHETTDTDPGNRHNQGRLFARNLHSEHEPLPDRVADKPRSSTRIRSAGGREFSKTKRRIRISGARVCHFALRLIRPKSACDHTWSKMCLVKLTASRGTNEDKRTYHAHRRHHAGGFSHVFVRVFSSENAGGGGDSLSNDSRSRIVHAALR